MRKSTVLLHEGLGIIGCLKAGGWCQKVLISRMGKFQKDTLNDLWLVTFHLRRSFGHCTPLYLLPILKIIPIPYFENYFTV